MALGFGDWALDRPRIAAQALGSPRQGRALLCRQLLWTSWDTGVGAQSGAKPPTHRTPWSSGHTPPSLCHLHVASLVGHHEGRGEAILMVEGTASQGVAHASDRCIPCQEEGEKAERSQGEGRWDSTRSMPSHLPQEHPDLVIARGSLQEGGSLQRPTHSKAPRAQHCHLLRHYSFPLSLQLPCTCQPLL